MPYRIILLSFVCALSACGWVDSTGRQATEDGGSLVNTTNRPNLVDGGSIAVVEQSSLTVALTGIEGNTRGWQWRPTNSGDVSQCSSVEGFFSDFAKQTLIEACTNPENCSAQINESQSNGVTEFQLQLPKLKASAAIHFELSAMSADGAPLQLQQTLCAVAINEAPLANTDFYRALSYRSRYVDSEDFNSILNNDVDDIDERNETLRILPDPIQSPQYAQYFELYSDGSFVYEFDDNIAVPPNGEIVDQFSYAVSDGLHASTATVNIAIVDDNRSPRRIDRIPNFDLELDQSREVYFYLDLNEYFEDPDADTLRFYANESSLFDSFNLALSESGILQGLATPSDLGEHRLTVIATDGLARAADTFEVSFDFSNDSNNTNPVASDIANRIVQNNFRYDVSEFFYDADGDQLLFSSSGLPALVTISSEGVISGQSVEQNRGVWFIEVTARDGRGGSVSDGFRLSIN
ncbi:MAG: hypothetical protein KTR35_17675 [Gammaproteobacteria bacterium]|nr:hypothetical protein [Gammaproteobacteria bacterium]